MKSAGSLTARLALAFALIAGGAFAGVGLYLYHALAMQIIERDDAELGVTRGGPAMVRHLPARVPVLEAGRYFSKISSSAASSSGSVSQLAQTLSEYSAHARTT